MTDGGTERHYLEHDPDAGYPAGPTFYYECLKCGVVVPSMPPDSVQCSCRNIRIDVDYGRVAVRDPRLMRIFAAEPNVQR